jgi:predicted nucleic acid-binding protein
MIDVTIGLLLFAALVASHAWGRERGRAEFRNGLRTYRFDLNDERTINRVRRRRQR